MTAAVLVPGATLVVVIGSEDWALAGLESSVAFANSARAIVDYFGPDYLGYPPEDILNLFNDQRDASAQVTSIGRFLRTRISEHETQAKPVTDIVIFYTGHGAFHHANNEYFLLVRNSEAGLEYTTGLQIRYLADCLAQHAPFFRKFIILDCCFAGAASAILQSSSSAQVAAMQTVATLPKRGTVLLCSSNSRAPSRIEPGQPYTMFSQALRTALFQGSEKPSAPEWLSFQDIRDLVWENLWQDYGNRAVRPVLMAPDQSLGDLTLERAVPNAAKATFARVQPSSQFKSPTAHWRNMALTSLVAMWTVYILTITPFLGVISQLHNAILVQFAIVTSEMILAAAIAITIGWRLRVSTMKCLVIGIAFAVGGEIGFLIQNALFTSAFPDDLFLRYSANGEMRFFGGCVAVAVVLRVFATPKIPMFSILGLTAIILTIRYLLFISLAITYNYPAGSLAIYATPAFLIAILVVIRRQPRTWLFGDIAVVLVPVGIFIINNILIDTGIVATPVIPSGLFHNLDDVFARLLFWFFIFPTAWTWPAVILRRPNLISRSLFGL